MTPKTDPDYAHSETALCEFESDDWEEMLRAGQEALFEELPECTIADREQIACEVWLAMAGAQTSNDLYVRLASLSKVLESTGRIDEHDYPDAYATLLDAMNFVQGMKTPNEKLKGG